MQAEKRQSLAVLTLGMLLLFLPAKCAAQAVLPLLPKVTEPCPGDPTGQKGMGLKLPSNAVQIARIIGVCSKLARLSELTTARITHHMSPSLEELWLRQGIAEAVITASLDVDSALSEIDYEQRQIEELMRHSQVRRDRALGTTNLAILTASTGVGIIAGALSFSNATSDAGDALAFATGGISTLFSLRGLRQSKQKGHVEGVLPNMLEPFLTQPQKNHHHYPEIVWAYLDSRPSGGSNRPTRIELLLAQWEMEGMLIVPAKHGSKNKISLLTTTRSGDKKLDMALLTRRSAMLADVGRTVGQIKSDLAHLLRCLR